MKLILTLILATTLLGCGTERLAEKERLRVSETCIKNDGVRDYRFYWSDNKEEYIVIEVTCKDGARFSTWPKP